MSSTVRLCRLGLKSRADRPSPEAMDKISGVAQSAVGGVQSSLKRLDAAARSIATAPVRRDEPTALADPLVDALAAQRSLEASAAVIRRADDALRSLLDALA